MDVRIPVRFGMLYAEDTSTQRFMILQTLASMLLLDLSTQAGSARSQSRTMPNLLFMFISTTRGSVLFGGCSKGAFA